jgi:hypothetical protein
MATTLTLNEKYPNWDEEDWKRFNWLNSWDKRRRNLARLIPCRRCGTAPVFEENHIDMPFHNIYLLYCPKCHLQIDDVYTYFRGYVSHLRINDRYPHQIVGEWNRLNYPLAQ